MDGMSIKSTCLSLNSFITNSWVRLRLRGCIGLWTGWWDYGGIVVPYCRYMTDVYIIPFSLMFSFSASSCVLKPSPKSNRSYKNPELGRTCKTSISSSLSIFKTTLTCPHISHLKIQEQNITRDITYLHLRNAVLAGEQDWIVKSWHRAIKVPA